MEPLDARQRQSPEPNSSNYEGAYKYMLASLGAHSPWYSNSLDILVSLRKHLLLISIIDSSSKLDWV